MASVTSHAQSADLCTPPKNLNDGWQTNHIGTQNIDTTLIAKLCQQLHTEEHLIHSVLLVRDKELVLEAYFGENNVSQPHDLRSATKSISAILMGIAIDKGFITDVNDPISKYLKELVPTKNLDERKAKITIKYLLTMSTGLDCNDWDKNSKGQEDKIYKKKDWLPYFLNLEMVNEPGEVANYCTMGQILANKIIENASGMSIDVFAEKYLFEPLAVTNYRWGHTSKKEVIPAGKRLFMTSRDMAKIGQLILNGGRWNDTQIVSENWITAATTLKTKITGIDYGYLWWNIPFSINNSIVVSKTATGNGGQYIMVFPELEMVAVFTGGAYNSQEDKIPFAILQDVFLPTFLRTK